MINKSSKIFIAGHNGMVGSSIKRCFKKNGYYNLLTASKESLNLITLLVSFSKIGILQFLLLTASLTLDRFKLIFLIFLLEE